jgi:hypothetical protein
VSPGQGSPVGPGGTGGSGRTGRTGSGAPAGRDRDATGRPRNARPRDQYGRPLPRGAAGQPPAADEPALPPAQALCLAQSLIDGGRPFRAHEVLEATWKAAPAAERELWRGLAQLAVGLTHAQRGNARGAVALLRRGAERVTGPAPARHGIDTAAVAAAARALATDIERAGLEAVPAGRLRLRLVQRADTPGRPAPPGPPSLGGGRGR